MATINIMLGGKGGIGKSTLSFFLAEYHLRHKRNLIAIDVDPQVGSFSSVPAFKAERFKLGDTIQDVNPRFFDNLMERILNAKEDDVIIIDTGGQSFNPLTAYLLENNVIPFLQENGHDVLIHSILVGGDLFTITVDGLGYLFDNFGQTGDVPLFCVWENPLNGAKVEKNGKAFEDSKLYTEAKESIHAIIKIPPLRRETFGYDLASLINSRMTFEEAIASPTFNIMARQRLKQIWDGIAAQLSISNI